VEISYKNRKIRKWCQDPKAARRDFGAATEKRLTTRLTDLRNAENVLELKAGDPHEYTGEEYSKGQGRYSLDLAGGNRLLFRPNHEETPKTKAGNINWQEVTKVTIVHIGPHQR